MKQLENYPLTLGVLREVYHLNNDFSFYNDMVKDTDWSYRF